MLSEKAEAILENLSDEMFSKEQIYYAMEDGEYLKNAGISQDIAEQIHEFLSEGL